MKKTLSPLILLSFLSVLSLMSCSDYGKKVKISGTKGEVYYKGEGASEEDATKVGNFLKETGFLSNDKAASIQIVKETEKYTVRFVYDKVFFDTTPGLETVFKSFAVKMSKELFNGKNVDMALSDKYFKDYKNIPYDTAFAKSMDQPKEGEISKDEFDHNTMGDVTFYWKDITSEESKTIAEYITKNGSFAGGQSEIYITKEGDRYILRFPVKQEFRNDIATINELKKIAGEIKENVFPTTPFTFQMTDEKLAAVKSFDY